LLKLKKSDSTKNVIPRHASGQTLRDLPGCEFNLLDRKDKMIILDVLTSKNLHSILQS